MVLLSVVVVLHVCCLARWAMTESLGGGLLLEDAAGLCVTAYVIRAGAVRMRRPAAAGPAMTRARQV